MKGAAAGELCRGQCRAMPVGGGILNLQAREKTAVLADKNETIRALSPQALPLAPGKRSRDGAHHITHLSQTDVETTRVFYRCITCLMHEDIRDLCDADGRRVCLPS